MIQQQQSSSNKNKQAVAHHNHRKLRWGQAPSDYILVDNLDVKKEPSAALCVIQKDEEQYLEEWVD